MTTLYASIAAVDKSSIARRIDFWRESLGGIGRWEVLFDNTGNALTGLTPASTNIVELKVDTVSLMKGYVDEYLPAVKDGKAIYFEEAIVKGRDYGRDLANKFQIIDYYNMKFDDLLEHALASGAATWQGTTAYVKYDLVKSTVDNGFAYTCIVAGTTAAGEPTWPLYVNTKIVDGTATWLCMSRSEVTYTSPNAGAVMDYSFKRHYLIDAFTDICKQRDSEFYVSDSKALTVFATSAPESSGVLLKSVAGDAANNILRLDPIGESLGLDIRNYIHVESGDVNDHWTEGNSGDWTAIAGCTLSDETGVGLFLAGEASIKITRAGAGIYGATLTFSVANCGYSSLDFSKIGNATAHFLVYQTIATGSSPRFRVRLTDSAATVIEYYSFPPGAGDRGYTDELPQNLWDKITFPVGVDCDIKAVLTNGFWWYIAGANFDWSNVVSLTFTSVTAFALGNSFYLDGLYLPLPAQAISKDATSKTAYGERMLSLSRTDLKSQNQLNAFAADELAKRKDYLQKLKLTCIGDTALKYGGQLVGVLAPTSGIGLSAQTTTADGNVGGTTVIDNSITEASDTWNYSFMKITSGACVNQEKVITDWNLATSTFTTEAFSEKVVSGVTYEIYTGYRILNLHGVAEPGVDLLDGHDFIDHLDLIKQTLGASVQIADPLRFKLGDDPANTLLRRVEDRTNALEKT